MQSTTGPSFALGFLCGTIRFANNSQRVVYRLDEGSSASAGLQPHLRAAGFIDPGTCTEGRSWYI